MYSMTRSTDLYENVRTDQKSPAIELTHYFESPRIKNVQATIDEIR
jgi:hypothetical protein